jgi:tRNA pseudouridine32 synthase/23S rRNA pseudouridine746 synthase
MSEAKRRVDVLNSPLPVVDGVAPSRQRLPAGAWETVLDFLAERHPSVGADAWAARMRKGEVADETGSRLAPSSPYRAGACVFYYREPAAETHVPFEARVLHQDEHILVADKPHFLPVVPAGRFLRETLLVRLKRLTGAHHLAPVHRIDRETAGVVVFSLDPATRGAYASLFQRREVSKVYEALAPALDSLDLPVTRHSRIVAGEPFFRMKEVEGEPNSETRVSLMARAGDAALYEARPLTGRKHQVRLHLSALGIPVLNDRLYPEVLAPPAPEDFSAPLKLLAKSVSFRDPLTGRERHFESGRKL